MASSASSGQAAQPDAIFKRNHIRYRCGPPDKPQGLGRSIVSELLTFLSDLGLEAAPKSPRPRRCRLGKISRNIDPPPAGQDDVARDHAQIPSLAAASLNHILSADRKPPRQTAGQMIYRHTHNSLLRALQNRNFQPPFSCICIK